jgi:hypothetical protein
MLQYSKLLNSRNEWKEKATERSIEVREFRKIQKRHREKIAELKQRNRELKQIVKNKKKEEI